MPYNTWNTPVTPYSYNSNPYLVQQGYPQQYQQTYAQQMQQAQQQQAQAQQPAPIQNGGFVSVPNIDVARNWAVAPGNSVMFRDESAPYIYTKTMGYNQLDTPRFERFRLVKEEDAAQAVSNASKMDDGNKQVDLSAYALKTDLDVVQGVLEAIKGEMSEFRSRIEGFSSEKPVAATKKKEGA